MLIPFLLAFFLYWIPPMVAAVRHHPNARAIFVLNLFLGWTIFGWVGALIWASTAIPKKSEPHNPWAGLGPRLEGIDHLRLQGETRAECFDRLYATREHRPDPRSTEKDYARARWRDESPAEAHARIRSERDWP